MPKKSTQIRESENLLDQKYPWECNKLPRIIRTKA